MAKGRDKQKREKKKPKKEKPKTLVQIGMKKAILLFTLVFFLAPQISGASSDLEQLSILQTQINLLLEEVIKLQEAINFVFILKFNTEPIPKDEIVDILKSGVNWFKAAQEENGHFKYEYVPYEDKYLDDVNIVRQAGSLSALGEIIVHEEDNFFEL